MGSKPSYCVYGFRLSVDDAEIFATEYLKKNNIVFPRPRLYIRLKIPNLNENVMDDLDIMLCYGYNTDNGYNYYLCFITNNIIELDKQKEKFLNWCSFYICLRNFRPESAVIQIYNE